MNEIQESICFCPGVADRVRPVTAGDGAEHHTVDNLDNDPGSSRDPEHHHHDFTGPGTHAGPDHADDRDQYQVQQSSQGETDRFDHHHRHTGSRADEADRHHDHHNHAGAASEEPKHHDDDHNPAPAELIAENRS